MGLSTLSKFEHIVTQLQHPIPVIRYSAAHALGELQDSRAVTPLFNTFIEDNSESVRQAAAHALVSLGIQPDDYQSELLFGRN